MIKLLTRSALVVAIGCMMGFVAGAEETTGEKVQAETNKTMDSAKEHVRNAQDEACEMVNGKMDCKAKKLKHKIKTLSDKAGTKAKEIKNKVD